jgi:hypothetical protein
MVLVVMDTLLVLHTLRIPFVILLLLLFESDVVLFGGVMSVSLTLLV